MLPFLIISLAIAITSAQAKALHIRDEWQPGNSSMPCLYMTSDVNWQGEQQNLCQTNAQCATALPDGLTANVSSAGPSEGQTCFLYTAENCGGNASEAIDYPGYADLSAIGFSKKARSWRCYKWSGYTNAISTITTTMTRTMARGSVLNAAASATDVSITATISGQQPTASPSSSRSFSSASSTVASTSDDQTITETVTETEMVTATKIAGTAISGSASMQASSTGVWNGTSLSFSVNGTHTFGGRGGSLTTLTTYVATA